MHSNAEITEKVVAIIAEKGNVPAAQVVPITQVESDVAGPNAEVVVLVGQNFAK